jgi:hypothetical protein
MTITQALFLFIVLLLIVFAAGFMDGREKD